MPQLWCIGKTSLISEEINVNIECGIGWINIEKGQCPMSIFGNSLGLVSCFTCQ
jgi:hypothetical protein